MAIRCASSGDRGRPPSRPLRGAEPTDLEPRGARDGAESEGARCRTFLVQIIPQRVGRTADSPKPPINPRTETGARHLNLTGAAAAQISLATAEKRRCDRGKTFCLLSTILRDCGLCTFAIVGIAVEIGIDPTVRHGTDLGLVPIVVQDACGAGDPEAGQRALANIEFMGDAIVTDTARFRAALVGHAGGAS